MSNTTPLNERSQNSVIILTILYVILSESIQGLSFTPNFNTAEFRLGIFIPAFAALVFGPLIGGLTAGIGNLAIDMYHVLNGTQPQFTFALVLGDISNFIGGYLIGWLAVSLKTKKKSFIKLFLDPKFWSMLLLNTIIAITGLGIVTGGLIGLILYYYSKFPLALSEQIFAQIAVSNAIVMLMFIPLAIFLMQASQILRNRKNAKVDKDYKHLDVQFTRHDAVKIEHIELKEHALWKNQWNPLTMQFSNKLDTPSVFIIEASSTSRIFPNLDHTFELQPGESFHQTFYILPLDQNFVDLRFSIYPKRQIEFRDQNLQRTLVEVKGNTIDLHGSSGLFEFSGINLVIFVMSILWSNIVNSVTVGVQSFADNLRVIGIIFGIELILFIPFVFFRSRALKKLKELSEENPLKLFLTQDFDSVILDDSYKVKVKEVIRPNVFIQILKLILDIILIASSALYVYDGFNVVYRHLTSVFKNYQIYFPLFIILLAFLRFKLIPHLNKENLSKKVLMEGGNILLDFKPLDTFRLNKPNDVLVTVINSQQRRGIRIRFQGLDIISPNNAELHLEPKEVASFKISITPIETGNREILAVGFPLFDDDGQYVDIFESEPFTYQKITFESISLASFGLTQTQFNILKKLVTYGTVAAGALLTVSQFVHISNFFINFRDSLPLLALLQIPIIYTYFYFNNRWKKGLRLN